MEALEDGNGHVLARPSGTAATVVRRYEAHSFSGLAPGFHRGLPSRAMTFRLSLGEPTAITAMPDASQTPASFSAFLGGLHASPAMVAHSGSGRGIGIDLSPVASRRLFGVPAGALGSTVVDLADVFGSNLAAELCERVDAADTWAARFRVLDDVIGQAVGRHEPAPPRAEVVEAWRSIVASRGRTSVEALAAHVGWSRRHLASQFNAEFGLPPKLAIRVVRFEWAGQLLLGDSPRSLADVAAEAGYFDQSHLSREWSEFAGCSPTSWMAEELHDPPRLDEEFPFLQDTDRRAG